MDIQSIRNSRSKGVAVFTKFCQEVRHNTNLLFCFFEGEDGKYYIPRIVKFTKCSYNHIISYNCGGRKEVMKAYKLICDKLVYKDVNMMFFIDRDYCPLTENLENIFQTPCYSIENFYTSSESFSQIITREFGLNVIDDDYTMCISDYKQRMTEFHEQILLFNAWLSCQRRWEEIYKENAINLANFKIAKLFSTISIDEVSVKSAIDIELLSQCFPKAYSIPDDELIDACTFFQNNDQQQLFRGKFEMDFLRKIIDSLKDKNKQKTYFRLQYDCVNINANINTISTLSEYADTPTCLIDFLTKHKQSK